MSPHPLRHVGSAVGALEGGTVQGAVGRRPLSFPSGSSRLCRPAEEDDGLGEGRQLDRKKLDG